VRKNEAAFRAQLQVAGEALRLSARVLQAAIKRESRNYLPLLDHTHILSEQIAQAAVCHLFHTIDQRLARWLLLARDRTRNGAFNITHEAMSQILGVSRSGVSLAAGLLQMKGLIRYARGRITLLNPEGLEVSSCECYRILSRTVNSLLPPDNRSATDRVIP
jgi:CRP-like cAMP-binding protein